MFNENRLFLRNGTHPKKEKQKVGTLSVADSTNIAYII